MALETRAWEEIREGRLTVETAGAAQAAITAHALAVGESRYEVEQALKARVRQPAEPPAPEGEG
ncbi:hypothetical protein FQU76_08860 [Streptomyces qinzhouensis]|uniref:Uncharacterized protein n=1 Tax=Streptomyces qinzhouensis TaxID=2599401 RepID=A0A5B8IQA8_9ACTN|nr:hypothetical protein FQU76_08860 [Streptomyces qinzhouensis]